MLLARLSFWTVLLFTCSALHAPQYPTLSSQLLPRGPFDESPAALRIIIVTSEFTGPVRNGGIATAYTTLALALAHVGHTVSVLFTRGKYSEVGPFEAWRGFYQARNVTLTPLELPPLGYLPRHMLTSYAVLLYLEKQDAQIVHFHEYEGAGYYSLLAKKQGLVLLGARTVVGMHGATLWAKQRGNQEALTDISDLERNFMEKLTVKLADYVVSPSRYMLEWTASQGWPTNPNSFVQPNLLPRAASRARRQRRAVWELVFFGRLESRKGIALFCDAVDLLLQPESPLRGASAGLRKVTFLGKAAMVDGLMGDDYVRLRAAAWDVDWAVETSLASDEANAYLEQEGRLAVMPSREENSPYTVLECAAAAVPFLASAVGGIPDLVAPEDRVHALVQPTAQHFAHRMARAIHEGIVPARPSVDIEQNEAAWLRWHAHIAQAPPPQPTSPTARSPAPANITPGSLARPHGCHDSLMCDNEVVPHAPSRRDGANAREYDSADGQEFHGSPAFSQQGGSADADEQLPMVSVVITHYNRAALCQIAVDSVWAQTYPADRLELVVVDDGSTHESAHAWLDVIEPILAARNGTLVRSANQYLGAARNLGLRTARGEFVLFMDDDNVAKPHEVATFVTAMQSSGADILTSFVDFFTSAGPPPPTRRHPSYMFLGGSAEVGAYKNCFGDANCFVRRSSLVKLGGYTEDHGVGYEDWEMYSKAVLLGYDVQIVPYSLYQYRFTPGSMQKSTDFVANRKRSLRAYLSHMPISMHDTLMRAVLPRIKDGKMLPLDGIGAQGLSKFPGAASAEGESSVSPHEWPGKLLQASQTFHVNEL